MGGRGWLYMYVCEAGSDIKSKIDTLGGKCVCLGVSLGSSLQEKAERVTRRVLSRLCGLKKLKQTQQHVWTRGEGGGGGRDSQDIYI